MNDTVTLVAGVSEVPSRFARFFRRTQARGLRAWRRTAPWLAPKILALFFVVLAWQSATWSHSALGNTPADFLAQSLSVLSIGRLSFEAAPRAVAIIEAVCALALLRRLDARFVAPLFFLRVVWGVSPLLMMRDDLWTRFPFQLSPQGWGVAGTVFLPVWALALALNAQSAKVLETAETAFLLHESADQIAARHRMWARGLAWGAPLLLALIVLSVSLWPRYLVWFHARQEAAALDEKLGGQLIRRSMPPSSLLDGRKITTWVYLPPGYDVSGHRYPVIYVLHGMPGEVRDCFVKGRVQDTADTLIQSRQVRPFILVGWDAQGPGGPSDVTNYLDRKDYPMESFITKELVPYIDKTYRTIAKPQDRALDGISAGGYGAANLMFKHPALWRIGASHTGFFSPHDDPENMTQILGAPGPLWNANDPTLLARGFSVSDGFHFYGDIGNGDDLQSEFLAFGRLLNARKIQNEMHVFSGRHTWEFWSWHFADSFRFADRWFEHDPSARAF